MRLFSITALAVICLGAFVTNLPAQKLSFAKINKDSTFDYTVVVPYIEQVEQQYTVQVPVQVDGKTQMKSETRTRLVNVRRAKLETRRAKFSAETFRFMDLKGKQLSFKQFKEKASYAVLLEKGRIIRPIHLAVLKEDVLVMQPIDKNKK